MTAGIQVLCSGLEDLMERGVEKVGGGGLGDGEAGFQRVPPGVRMLLFGARRQVRNQIVFLRGRGDDLAVARVHDQDLGRLGAAINAEQEGSHNRMASETLSEIPRPMSGGKCFSSTLLACVRVGLLHIGPRR